MQIVIDIPEERYKHIQEEQWLPNRLLIEKAIANGTPLDDLRAEIERLHYHPKLDFIKNDEVVDMALDIIDKYKAESEDKE